MRGLLWFLVVAALAVGLALAARVSEGYVLLVAPPYRAELSLALFVALLLGAFGAAYSLLRLVVHTVRLPEHVEAFREQQRKERGEAATHAAWLAYLEGRHRRALQLAGEAFAHGPTPGIAALIAARAAHGLRDRDRRDAWLARADGDGMEAARRATQAELLLDERRFEEARGVLRQLLAETPNHTATLRMLLRAEQALEHWDEVPEIVRQLERQEAISPEHARQLHLVATMEGLRAKGTTAEQVRAAWRAVPPPLREEPRVVQAAAESLLAAGDSATAEQALRTALEAEWNEPLLQLYGRCEDDRSLDRLERAERWLVQHPHDPLLLLILGRLCTARELWGKAEHYLQSSIEAHAGREAHLELARLYERLGRADEATEHYRAAAESGSA